MQDRSTCYSLIFFSRKSHNFLDRRTRMTKPSNDGSPQRKKRIVEATIINHTYTDYSTYQIAHQNVPSLQQGSNIDTFPRKLHYILSRPDYRHIISWMPHGRAWKILDKELLVSVVCKEQFKHEKFESFNRQVNGWGFKRLLRNGPDYKCYYNQCFLRGRPDLTCLMFRLDKPGKRLPNKLEEPDLYEISRRYPLPEINVNPTSQNQSSDSNSIIFSVGSSSYEHQQTTIGLACNENPEKNGTVCLIPSPTSVAPQPVSRGSSEDRLSQWKQTSQKESYSSLGNLTSPFPVQQGQTTHQKTTATSKNDSSFSSKTPTFDQGLTHYNENEDKYKRSWENQIPEPSKTRCVQEPYDFRNNVGDNAHEKVVQDKHLITSSTQTLDQSTPNVNSSFREYEINNDMKRFDSEFKYHMPFHSFDFKQMRHHSLTTAQGSFTSSDKRIIHHPMQHQRVHPYQSLKKSVSEAQLRIDSLTDPFQRQGGEPCVRYARSSGESEYDEPAEARRSFHYSNEKHDHDQIQHRFDNPCHSVLTDPPSHLFEHKGFKSDEQHGLCSFELNSNALATTQGTFPHPNDRPIDYPMRQYEYHDEAQKQGINTVCRIDAYSNHFEHQVYHQHRHDSRYSSGLDNQTPAATQVAFHYANDIQNPGEHVQDPQCMNMMYGTAFEPQGYESNQQYAFNTFGLDHPPHHIDNAIRYHPPVQAVRDHTNQNGFQVMQTPALDPSFQDNDKKFSSTSNIYNSLSSSLNDSIIDFEPSPSMFDDK